MKFRSLTDRSIERDFASAVIEGIAPDRGLYFPEVVPVLDESVWLAPENASPGDFGATLLTPFVGASFDPDDVRALFRAAIDFPIELVALEDGRYVLELFHGPTAAFKDVGARSMARLLAGVSSASLTVLVATSGDTGSAVAAGFQGVPGIDVVILYPGGRVSPLQERQLTTAGGNIHALEIQGNFDDCQALVKQAFLDAELRARRPLTSANSINIARWMPQGLYYAYATYLLGGPVHFVVPSGNLGNLAAGVLAHRMGMPAAGFTAATNANDVYPQYLAGGAYTPRPSVATLSNAMDVGDPSNAPRLDALFAGDRAALRAAVRGATVSEAETAEEMQRTWRESGYMACPHTAVGLAAARNVQSQLEKEGRDLPVVVLGTAHPAKFSDAVHSILGTPPDLPDSIAACLDKPTYKTPLPADYTALRDWLLAPASSHTRA
jgi:threonine synthase